MTARQYINARHALRAAYAQAPTAIGWKPGGWIIYDPTDGAPPGVAPEMLVLRQGSLPVPLSENGLAVIRSAFTA